VWYPGLAATVGAPLRPGLGVTKGREGPMASLFKRAKDFAQSPERKKLTEEVKEQASKPENRRKLKEFGQRFMKKR
jgi:hypothetical protein